ncbi:hypothetical protein [Paramaledivibacter caminithermalis]|jgi:hypothetical protein|uniref:Uncharacterized protein n=1 Tax=Paramaledivibacter caminithermalis (strain DSM 15212 / CIP 107654 / DViRD3) TaxID=1121301 RepID=A0A1M6THI5_PARC5|nr:hypothetical protein [Paramaledivibacter caminithermalis]SHK56400.1 hypothetical protein SAMN02745912_03687 [Paramaledivibacter caminithermalis DSM 15212]
MLFNYCEGDPEYDYNGNLIDTHYHKNDSNARFCEICGQRTVFFKEELLKPWEEFEKQNNSSIFEIATTFEENDDIPF